MTERTKPFRGNLVPVDHICCPTWQHFYPVTGLPRLTAFTSPFSRPGATRFSPHDRHAMPCRAFGLTGHGGSNPKWVHRAYCQCAQNVHAQTVQENRPRGNPVHNATIYYLSRQHPRRATEMPQLAGVEGDVMEAVHTRPSREPCDNSHGVSASTPIAHEPPCWDTWSASI